MMQVRLPLLDDNKTNSLSDIDLSVSIVIPVSNEENVLEQNILTMLETLRNINHLKWEIILVENGSVDNTRLIAQKLSKENPCISVLYLPEANYGKALKEGMLTSTGDIIVNFDIDYWDINFLVESVHIMKLKYDIIIASKQLPLSKDLRGPMRKITSFGFRVILYFIFGLLVSDTHGIKAWRNSERLKDYLRKSFPSKHTYDTEVVLRAVYDNCDILEVPVEVVETRKSERHILKRIPLTLKELYQMFFRLKK